MAAQTRNSRSNNEREQLLNNLILSFFVFVISSVSNKIITRWFRLWSRIFVRNFASLLHRLFAIVDSQNCRFLWIGGWNLVVGRNCDENAMMRLRMTAMTLNRFNSFFALIKVFGISLSLSSRMNFWRWFYTLMATTTMNGKGETQKMSFSQWNCTKFDN